MTAVTPRGRLAMADIGLDGSKMQGLIGSRRTAIVPCEGIEDGLHLDGIPCLCASAVHLDIANIVGMDARVA